MLEATIERYLAARCADRGALVRKLQWIGRKGAPDRFIAWPGGLIDLVELKAPGRKPDGHQQRELGRLRALGANVFVIDSLAAVNKYIEERS